MRYPRTLGKGFAVGLPTLVLLVTTVVAASSVAAPASPPSGALIGPAANSGPIFLNLTATSAVSFVPAELDVTPGSSVHLRILQAADFNHTFTLSSLANYTLPSTDSSSDLALFFAAHPPLVNLSLGDVAGTYHYANFTAPPVGSYEFVCLIPTHFQSGMHGTLVSSTSPSSASGGGLDPTTLAVIVVVAVAVIGIAAALLIRRRPKVKA